MRYANLRVVSLTIIDCQTKNRRRISSTADSADGRTQASRVSVYPRRNVVVSRPDICSE